MRFQFKADEDTQRLFEIVVYFLQRYFKYDEETAIGLVERYYEKCKQNELDDDYYHRQGAFHVAVQVHYFFGLNGDKGKFEQWMEDNGYWHPPREAIDYFDKHYFKRS